jgi:hypothetical protein
MHPKSALRLSDALGTGRFPQMLRHFRAEPGRVRFRISLTLGGKAKFAAQVADLIECREGFGPLYISPEMDAV